MMDTNDTMDYPDYNETFWIWNTTSFRLNQTGCCIPGVERFIVPILFSLVVLIGCFGNSLVIVVVLKNKDFFRTTTNMFILNLSIADLLFLVFCVPFHAIIYTSLNWPFGEAMCKLVHLIQYASMVASIFTLVCMSVDRYLAVVYPLQTKHIRRPIIALGASVAIWIMAVAIAAPWPVFYKTRVYDDLGPHPVVVCADDWGHLRKDRSIYFLVLFLLTYALPLMAIAVLSTLMVHSIWKHPIPECPSLEETLRQRRHVTRLVIVVVVTFFLCWFPSHLLWLWTSYFPDTWKQTYPFYYFRVTSHVLAYTNSSLNPILYCFLSENFRHGFAKALKINRNRIMPTYPPFSRTIYSNCTEERPIIGAVDTTV